MSSSLLTREMSGQAGDSQGQVERDPAGTIDGSQTPELISREVAFLMILRAFAEPVTATAEQVQRAKVRMSAIGLTKDDAVAFRAILTDLLTKVEELDIEAQVIRAANPNLKPGSSAWHQLGKLNSRRVTMVRESLNSIAVKLTAEGLQKVEDFLNKAKTRIKIFPGY